MEKNKQGTMTCSRRPRNARRSALLLLLIGSLAPCAYAGPYDTAGQRAADWLAVNMIPADKTWGSEQDLKYLGAAQVALGLASWNRRGYEYYAALTWLSNHTPANVDFASRRILALGPGGQSLSRDLNFLSSVQFLNLSAPGNGGLGLNAGYQGSALDTALALQAYTQAAATTNVPAAITSLKNAQLTGSDKGWAIGQATASDPITTAQVLIALMPYRGSDPTLVTPIANGLAALSAKVGVASTPTQKALSALANFRNNAGSLQAATLFGSLVATQAADGSWGGDVQATAVALRALAAGAGRDAPLLRTAVVVADDKLRAAINAALSRNALDTLNQGELAQLTSLNISGQGVTTLTGLEYATKLTYLDASYNSITSWTPVESLPQQPTTVRDGNPGYPVDYRNDDVPTLPQWGAILMGALLMLFGFRSGRVASARRHLGS